MFGRAHAATASDPVTKTYRRLFGAEDIHGHFRWNAVRRYVDPYAKRTLEVGCGEGWMTVEVARLNPNTIYASDFDDNALRSAQTVAQSLGLSGRVHFTRKDLRELNSEEQFDQVLAVDVLEHIDDDELAIRQIADALAPNGRFVVSVPTPRYPKSFGQEYADQIGHVRDGYWLEDLEPKLTAAGFEVRAHHYYTGGLLSWIAGQTGSPRLRALAMPAARPIIRLDERRADRENSSSLALLAVKSA